MELEVLTEREKSILEIVVQQFVLTGSPIGSRTLSKKHTQKLSPASIRNVMADLEDKGYLDHPHTSAGRVPTTKGYRLYVDNLIQLTQLSEEEKKNIQENIGLFNGDVDFILEKTSHVLAKISRQLGVILTPKFDDGILEKIDIIQVASEKILVVLSIKNGIARTILLEVQHDLNTNDIIKLVSLLNEKLAGLSIKTIKQTFRDRFQEYMNQEEIGLVRVFIDSADKIFDFKRYADLKLTGASNIITSPEFRNVEKFSALIELFEEKNIIIHMLDKFAEKPGLKVTIGEELEEVLVQECSVVSAPYKIGTVDGILGVIGPMRMAYRKVIPVVDFTARLITKMFEEKY